MNEVLTDIQSDIDQVRAKGLSVGQLSDGYHTFDDLYRHRIALYIALAKQLSQKVNRTVWISDTQSDGNKIQGWFLLGINTKKDTQITYHVPMSEWDTCKEFAIVKRVAPEWDGHTSDDILARLAKL